MDDDLPTDFDVIVVGTGMTESIVAAAISRIGKRVLHFDSDDFYGGLWASFNFESLLKIAKDPEIDTSKEFDNIGLFNIESEWFLQKKINITPVTNTVTENKDETIEIENKTSAETIDVPLDNDKKVVPESKPIKSVDNNTKNVIEWNRETLRKEYRKFNLDLAPKLLFARGELVELLISSNIARYTEFRCVNRVLTWLNNVLEPVPCSRADVFATKHVTVVEKRMLMKLLSALMEFDENNKSSEFADIENKTFLEYLKSKKLTTNLIHYVLYAIAGGTDTMTCIEGIKKCKIFLTSLGRYGNTPFLWSMYGCGELPQCFCRLCAVYGGVYCLKRRLDSIKIIKNSDSEEKVEIESQGKILTCDYVVLGTNRVPKEFVKESNVSKGISRAIIITNGSILEFEKESLTLLQFPPIEGKKNPVTIIELGPSTCSCPKGLYILHMTCKQSDTAKEDLQQYAENLVDFSMNEVITSKSTPKGINRVKPKALWCVYFNMKDASEENISTSSKIHICSGPDTELDFDHAVKQGRKIFSTIYKDEEFLPRAPDPEEIVFDGEDSNTGPIFEKDINKNFECENSSPQADNELNMQTMEVLNTDKEITNVQTHLEDNSQNQNLESTNTDVENGS